MERPNAFRVATFGCLCLLPSLLLSSPWNLPENTLKLWGSHATFLVQRQMNDDGSVGARVQGNRHFLQSSGLSLGYSPTWRLHGGVLLLFERAKDDLGRPAPTALGDSFGNYGLRWFEAEAHYGLSDQELTKSLGAFYNVPVGGSFSEATHTFGLKAAAPLPQVHSEWTLTLTTKGALSRSFGGEGSWNAYALAQAEAFWDFSPIAQLQATLEGLYSTWHYLKARLGMNLPLKGDDFKIGLHYTRNFLGKWVLPSDSIELSLESRVAFGR